MGYEDSYADPTSLDLLLSMFINLTMIDLDVQRSWWMPLWSFDLDCWSGCTRFLCHIQYHGYAENRTCWKVSSLSSISMNLHTIKHNFDTHYPAPHPRERVV